jgi:POT family proton-dependent oligopeptide transporter
MQPIAAPSGVAVPQPHPRGLYTLFFTEMWERFSFYGMRALLVLFMVAPVQTGGMALPDEIATAIYGLYSAAVYLAALPGGWIADRLLGAQRSVWYGGLVIATGHFVLAMPSRETFYLGLILVVAGTGLLKPNISAIVGELYPEGGARRDAGFSIFYMGINLGAFIGPLICSTLGEKVNWHYGFAAAGVGMMMGLIQFRLTRKHLGEAGLHRGSETNLGSRERAAITGTLGIVIATVVLSFAGVIQINPVALARSTTVLIVGVALAYFAYVLLFSKLDHIERQRMGVIIILFLAAALFWSGFEQAGSSFNLFAERYTFRESILPDFLSLGRIDFVVPAGWFQSLGPIFIILLAPVMAGLWVSLARRNLNPSLPVKFGWGLLLLALGFCVMAAAARRVAAGHQVWPTWLITTYLVHTFGELCLSPVGLSSVTKLAPRRLVGQMMGVWFLAASLGNLIAGLLAGSFRADAVQRMPAQYLNIALVPTLGGLLLIACAKPIRKWMAGVN